ncbi:LacI family DNA-binding transcriptional regulator [Phycisphaerales bacterium AB-hyl4]|uniref:LacI family DNA-binding transcriptional regulator n=1 Tax=Natronomicrosphaera hydrolytica TaxID=3242702 RepID=A0ABV4U5X4_9BACT
MSSSTKNLSIAGLAKSLSLSVGTVSEALNDNPRVNVRTRKRVVEAALEAGYVPNRQAAALRRQKSRIIGMLLPTLSNPIYIERVASAQRIAYQHGYEISFASSEWRADQEANLSRHFLGLGVDALIIDGAVRKMRDQTDHGVFKPFFDRKIPVLKITHRQRPAAPDTSELFVDVASGICEALEHLLALQHRHIGFVGIRSDPNASNAPQREGIQRAIGQVGDSVQTEFIGPAAQSMGEAYQVVRDRLQQADPFPTAIQAVGDQVAIGVLKALDDHGLRVPEDVSVVGFDNLEVSAFYKPSLTTVSQTHLDLGRKAVETVLDRIENNSQPRKEKVNLELVVRDSTAPAPVNFASQAARQTTL